MPAWNVAVIRRGIKNFIVSDYFLETIASVSRAIINSSSVGMTTTFTLDAAVETTASLPRIPGVQFLIYFDSHKLKGLADCFAE